AADDQRGDTVTRLVSERRQEHQRILRDARVRDEVQDQRQGDADEEGEPGSCGKRLGGRGPGPLRRGLRRGGRGAGRLESPGGGQALFMTRAGGQSEPRWKGGSRLGGRSYQLRCPGLGTFSPRKGLDGARRGGSPCWRQAPLDAAALGREATLQPPLIGVPVF